MKEYEKFKVGERHKCCGGDDCLILAISEKRVLILILMPQHYRMFKMVVGNDPHECKGELAWWQGHYYHVDEKHPKEILAAWKDWDENH